MSVWNVYIDETYLDNIQQARIITSFFAIDANESKEVIEKYQKKIIKKAADCKIKLNTSFKY